jgi:biotin carboxyl carrier protein
MADKPHLIQLPDTIVDNTEFDASIDGKPVKLRWQRQTRTLFVLMPDDNAGWTPLNLRTRTVTRFAGDGELAVSAEFSASGARHPANLEATVSLYVPGLGSGENNTKKKPAVIRSQITGKVLKVFVKPGDEVKSGDTLMIIEAMKMENRVVSHTAGVIDTIKAKEAETVSTGAELIKFK